MDSLNKMKLGVLLNNITGGMAVSQSQQATGGGGIKLSGLGQIGLGNEQGGFMTNQQQQNQILASQLISNARLGQNSQESQPFFNLPMQQAQQNNPFSLKRPRENNEPSSAWLMHQVNGASAPPPTATANQPNSNSSATTQQEEGGEKGTSRRRTVHQLEVLESVFKLCPNPTEVRRKQLGQMLKMDERQVVIWFQNKRQRVRAKMKEQENNTLRQQHTALKTELHREKSRERALEQENALLKSCMEEKVKKMEELRQASSELLVEYYKKKGGNLSEWKDHLPSGLMDALKLPKQKDDDEKLKTTTEEKEKEREKAESESDKAATSEEEKCSRKIRQDDDAETVGMEVDVQAAKTQEGDAPKTAEEKEEVVEKRVQSPPAQREESQEKSQQ